MLLFFQSTAVTSIGSGPVTRTSPGNETLIANIFNSAVVTRTVTMTVSGQTFSFDIAANAATSIAIEREGDLTFSANGAGVFGWIGRRVGG